MFMLFFKSGPIKTRLEKSPVQGGHRKLKFIKSSITGGVVVVFD